MQVHGPSQVHNPHTVKGPHRGQSVSGSPVAPTQGPTDQVDISPAAEAAIQAAEQGTAADGGLRTDLVARVRQEIAAGTYETPDKLDAALDRLLDQIG